MPQTATPQVNDDVSTVNFTISAILRMMKLHEKPCYYLLIMYVKKLCSHVRKSHLEIKKI